VFSCTPVRFLTQVGRQSENYVYVTAKIWIQLSAHLLEYTKLQQCVAIQFLHANLPPPIQCSFTEQWLYNTAIPVAQLVKCKLVEEQATNCQTCVVDEELPRWTQKTPQYWMCVHRDIFAFGLTLTSRKCWFYAHIVNFSFYWFFWCFMISFMHDWQTYFILSTLLNVLWACACGIHISSCIWLLFLVFDLWSVCCILVNLFLRTGGFSPEDGSRQLLKNCHY